MFFFLCECILWINRWVNLTGNTILPRSVSGCSSLTSGVLSASLAPLGSLVVSTSSSVVNFCSSTESTDRSPSFSCSFDFIWRFCSAVHSSMSLRGALLCLVQNVSLSSCDYQVEKLIIKLKYFKAQMVLVCMIWFYWLFVNFHNILQIPKGGILVNRQLAIIDLELAVEMYKKCYYESTWCIFNNNL